MSSTAEAPVVEKPSEAKFTITPAVKYAMVTLAVLLIVTVISIIVIRHEKKKYENKCQELFTVAGERDEKDQQLNEQSMIINQLQKQLQEASKPKPKQTLVNAGMTIPKVTGPSMSDEQAERPKPITQKQIIKNMVNSPRTTNEDLMKVEVDPQDELDAEAEKAIKQLTGQEEPEEVELPILNEIIPNSA